MMMEAAVVVAGLDRNGRVCGGRWSVFGAVPLAHEVTNAQHGRVENQVAPAAFGGAVCTTRVGPQRLAKLSIEAIQRRVQVRRERDEVCGALLDTALRSLDLTFTWKRTRRKMTKRPSMYFSHTHKTCENIIDLTDPIIPSNTFHQPIKESFDLIEK